MLARLDQMAFEGSLLPEEDPARATLHAAVRDQNEKGALAAMKDLDRVEKLEPVSLLDNPTLARGRRRLAALRIHRGTADTSMLHEALERRDAVTVRELLGDA
jgi:hypothetical protein